MIDIHAHILPGRDDGPTNDAEALRMALAAAASGTRRMVATPHCHNGVHHSTREEILDGCRRLNEHCRARGVQLEIHPGAEIRLIPEMLTLYDQGRLMTMNDAGGHILLELPEFFVQKPVRDLIARFRERGVTVILAHPERQPYLIHHLESVTELVEAGARLQITAASLTGRFGRLVRKTAHKMIRQGWVDWVASDGHGHADRVAVISSCRAELERLLGKERAYQILFVNPLKVLNDAAGVPDIFDIPAPRPTGSSERRATW